jgi:hypothetical protein
VPFTYYLYHKPTQKHYYGARWAKNATPDTLWTTYFSSSSAVHSLINQYGKDSFVVRVMRVFDTGVQARMWEHRFIKKVNAVENDQWINVSNGQPPVCNYSRVGQGVGRKLSDSHRKAISKGNKGKLSGRSQSPEHVKNAAIARTGRKLSQQTKDAMGAANRSIQPVYRFAHPTEGVFVGKMYQWCVLYSINKRSASTVFSNNRSYRGWVRSFN